MQAFDIDVDVVVLGSGAGGMLAALTAHELGARVLLLEKAPTLGGTTAVSGGVIWIPMNHHLFEVGCTDSREDAVSYMKLVACGKGDDAGIERYVDAGPLMVRYVEERFGVTFTAMPKYPDYQPELPGGRTGGRALDNGLFDTTLLGEKKGLLRKNPVTGRSPITIPEAIAWGVFSNPLGIPYKEVSARAKQGVVHGGASLCGKLFRALLDRGVDVRTETAGVELVVGADGGIDGLVARGPAGELRVRAHKGVVLASGGFEWNPELTRRFLAPDMPAPASPPYNTGDALQMAMRLGADLLSMNEGWWTPVVDLPGELYDGVPLHRCEFSARCLPHSIIVNRRGERFTNEAGNYNDITKPFFHHDPATYSRRNAPAYLVVDHQFLEKYVFVTAVNGRPIPDYITTAPSLAELAEKLGVDAAGLERTVARVNAFAADGKDLDFGRGDSAFDRLYGDPRSTPNPNLGTLERAPFYALPIRAGTMGTKGGPRCTVDGNVVRVDGDPIRGLYACGNAMGSIAGHGYPGPGITIGASMVFGWLAARHALGQPFAPAS